MGVDLYFFRLPEKLSDVLRYCNILLHQRLLTRASSSIYQLETYLVESVARVQTKSFFLLFIKYAWSMQSKGGLLPSKRLWVECQCICLFFANMKPVAILVQPFFSGNTACQNKIGN